MEWDFTSLSVSMHAKQIFVHYYLMTEGFIGNNVEKTGLVHKFPRKKGRILIFKHQSIAFSTMIFGKCMTYPRRIQSLFYLRKQFVKRLFDTIFFDGTILLRNQLKSNAIRSSGFSLPLIRLDFSRPSK